MCLCPTSVTASLFSDFGPEHLLKDPDGTPTTVCAVESLQLIKLHENSKAGWIKPDGWRKEMEGQERVVITVANETKRYNIEQYLLFLSSPQGRAGPTHIIVPG